MIICMNTPMVGTIEIMFALQMYKIQIFFFFFFEGTQKYNFRGLLVTDSLRAGRQQMFCC